MTGSESPTRPQPTGEPAADQEDARRAEIPHDLFCQECGYNLRALTSDRCPECGHSLESVRAARPQIPWVDRKELGRFRAYWRTVRLVMFRQRRFCEEMARPVSYRDAQWFRWVTILHVYGPILLVTPVLYTGESGAAVADEGLMAAAMKAVWPVPLFHLLILLYLTAITGVPSYFFHPSGTSAALQNRAIALSYYASGPLALAVLPVIAAVAAMLLQGIDDLDLGPALFAIVFPVAQLLTWLIDLLHLSRRLMPQFRRRAYLILVCVPALWLALAGLILVGIPFSLFYVVLIVATTR